MEEPDINKLLEPARAAREQVDLFVPVIVWQPKEGDPILALAAPIIGDMKEDLTFAFAEMEEQFGRPVWFSVTCDAYAQQVLVQKGEPSPDPNSTNLGDAFHAGDPTVVEQLVVACATGEGIEMVRQVYRFIPTEGWGWEKIVPFNQSKDIIREAMETVQLL